MSFQRTGHTGSGRKVVASDQSRSGDGGADAMHRKRPSAFSSETVPEKRQKKTTSNRDLSSTSESESSDDDPNPMNRKRAFPYDGDDTPSKQMKHTGAESHSSMDQLKKLGNYSDFAGKMMEKMGYQAGSGLGKSKQGRVDIVHASQQRGRRGLGLRVKTEDEEVVVDWTDEKPPSAVETIDWIPPYEGEIPDTDELNDWVKEGEKKLTIDDESTFCNQKILQTLLKCKTVFDELEGFEMRKARTRSNPYELIKGAIFLNRAAMKMANMDHRFDFMFTSPKDLGTNDLLYFADICAGPGGFSEYVLWRRKWKAKGFGFTLKGANDFKLNDFYSADPELFEPHYGLQGADGSGDIMQGENMEAFQEFVLTHTDGQGVHFVMADGGFSVEGQENIQEILTKQLLLCQFACALSILRAKGCFVCKTFDLFTPFSVGLIYLLRIAFEHVAIFKPVTSRPANSERYVVCKGYRDPERRICDYLLNVNETLNDPEMQQDSLDVREVVPFEMMSEDEDFMAYVKYSNESLAQQQCKALSKIHAFTKDRNLMEPTQADMRDQCLRIWGIPNKARIAPPKGDAASRFQRLTGLANPSTLLGNAHVELKADNLSALERIYNYKCYLTGSRSTIILSMGGSHVFSWNSRFQKWSHLDQLKCSIPRNTILEVEIVEELKGEGKGQRRCPALHVVDALVLAGEDVSKHNFSVSLSSDRSQYIAMFCRAISKPTLRHLTTVRPKTVYRLEEVQRLFERLSMKLVKGAGHVPRVVCSIPDTDQCFVPSGVVFVKTVKAPWSMEFSRSTNRKYFYNENTRTSQYDSPPDSNAPYALCASTRVLWWWGEKVKVHPMQAAHRPDLVSAEQLTQFVQSHCATKAKGNEV